MTRRFIGPLVALVVLALSGATAATAEPVAQSAAGGATGTSGPVSAKLSTRVLGAEAVGGRSFALRGSRVSLRAELSRYAEGVSALVTISRAGRKILRREVRFSRVGNRAALKWRFAARKGRYRIRVKVIENDLLRVRRPAVRVLTAVSGLVRRGQKGVAVSLVQAKLTSLGFAVPRAGHFNDATARAVLAYRKTNGMSRVTRLNAGIVRRLVQGKGTFKLRLPKGGHHIEIDLSRQVMALADGRKVERIYHVSTGASVTPTIRGKFRVYRKSPGTNAKGMVHSAYFIRGYAVHGFASVPVYPASHGCIRVPIPDARSIFDWIRMNDRVYVYR